MLAKVKFCGMKRPQDAALAAEIGAAYVGTVFADGPRRLSAQQAREVFSALSTSVKKVGVFGTNDPGEIARMADQVGLDVVQLHSDPTVDEVARLRRVFHGDIWAAIRIAGNHIPSAAEFLFEVADAVVLDSRSEKALGGTGQALPWNDLAADLARDRGGAAVVLAGGLTPKNVASAVRTLGPDVVDVSSGVEHSAGVKDPWLMREFFAAATGPHTH